MSIKIIDTHSHLHFDAYNQNRSEILSQMSAEECATIAVGTNGATSQMAIELAERESLVYAAVGYHPNFFTSAFVPEEERADEKPYSKEQLEKIILSRKRIVALGETGLDYYRLSEELHSIEEGKNIQKGAFIDHLDLGITHELPIVVHCREAFDDLIQILSERKKRGINDRCVIHCFTGDWELAQNLLELGCHLSFTGIITFPEKKGSDPEKAIARVIERMPLERMMIETDAPWLAPIPHRGEQNNPTYVRFIAEKIAELRKKSVDEIVQETTINAKRFFSITE